MSCDLRLVEIELNSYIKVCIDISAMCLIQFDEIGCQTLNNLNHEYFASNTATIV